MAALVNSFSIWAFRFHFRADGTIYFPRGKAGNVLRGAFGSIFRRIACVPHCQEPSTCELASQCPYASIFEPRQQWAGELGPSGLADWPRPFVFRALHLDGREIARGEEFWFDLILFEPPEKTLPYFLLAFRELTACGLGPGRGRAALASVTSLADSGVIYDGHRLRDGALQAVPCTPGEVADPCHALTVRFVTPTELKAGGELVTRPEFGVFLRRLRDRVSNLRKFYQGGELEIEFTAMAEAADRVRLVDCRLRYEETERYSTRTGQRHPLGGFVGEVDYSGELGQFLWLLRIGEWTGVGRQTVWGKGYYLVAK